MEQKSSRTRRTEKRKKNQFESKGPKEAGSVLLQRKPKASTFIRPEGLLSAPPLPQPAGERRNRPGPRSHR